MDLEAATTARAGDFDVPAGWRQGRGAYGGLVCAAMIRAIENRLADPARAVRSVTAEIPAPVEPGTARIEVSILRAGKSVTTARAELVQGGEIRAHAVVVAGAARRDAPAWNDVVPPVGDWRQVPVVSSGLLSPEFAAHFEYRLVEGAPLARGAPRTIGWIRARAPGTRRDAAYIAALIDAWYPGALARLPALRPMATIAFTLDVFTLDGLADDTPLLYRGEAPVASDGYFVETRELWRADGALVARNHQTFVVIA